MKGDSFTVDMEPFSHLSNKDLTLSSRIIRSPSRKESQKGTDKKINSNYVKNEGDGDTIHSPKGSLMAGAMPEKLMLLDQTTDHINSPQVHHQITIMTSGTTPTATTAAATTGTPTKSSVSWKRSKSFKQSSIINPRRILMFFATLSSMGTVLLICLTLSMSRYTEDDNTHA